MTTKLTVTEIEAIEAFDSMLPASAGVYIFTFNIFDEKIKVKVTDMEDVDMLRAIGRQCMAISSSDRKRKGEILAKYYEKAVEIFNHTHAWNL